ncbi:hypothetical protein ACWA1C_06500 [Flectobacillus roseus]
MRNLDDTSKNKHISFMSNNELKELEIKHIQVKVPPDVSFYVNDTQSPLLAIIVYDIDKVLILRQNNLTEFGSLLSSIGIKLNIKRDGVVIMDSKGNELENCSDETMCKYFKTYFVSEAPELRPLINTTISLQKKENAGFPITISRNKNTYEICNI